jgi:hypothetical protein
MPCFLNSLHNFLSIFYVFWPLKIRCFSNMLFCVSAKWFYAKSCFFSIKAPSDVKHCCCRSMKF